MDSGVGSPGGFYLYFAAFNFGQDGFEGALDGGQAGLDLPAVVVGAVVGYCDLPVGSRRLRRGLDRFGQCFKPVRDGSNQGTRCSRGGLSVPLGGIYSAFCNLSGCSDRNGGNESSFLRVLAFMWPLQGKRGAGVHAGD